MQYGHENAYIRKMNKGRGMLLLVIRSDIYDYVQGEEQQVSATSSLGRRLLSNDCHSVAMTNG